MSSDPSYSSSTTSAGMAGWQKILLVVAGLFVVVGAGLKGYAMMTDDGEPDTSQERQDGRAGSASFDGQTSLFSGDGSGVSSRSDDEPADGAATDWSPFFLKGGFGLFLGFCMGYVVRKFLKLAMLGVGGVALVLFGLQYAGVVDVQWDTISGQYDSIVERVKEESQSFWTFIQGSIPSATAATLGLIAGFKKG